MDFKDAYKTKDGKNLFMFSFHWNKTHYNIDIIKMPSYRGRSEDLTTIHLLPSEDTRGRRKICLGDPTVANSPMNARKWAGIWAELTMQYIKTGAKFPQN